MDWKWQHKAKPRCEFPLKLWPSCQSHMSNPCDRRVWLHGARAVGALGTRGAPLTVQTLPALLRVSPQITADISQYACARRGFQLRAGATPWEECVGDWAVGQDHPLCTPVGEVPPTGTHHFFLCSTAALTFSSLQPGWIYFYSRSVSHGFAKLLKTGDPSCWVTCSNSSKEALGLAAVREIYWHNYSCSLQGPVRLHSSALALSAGCTQWFTAHFSQRFVHLQSADTSVGWLGYLFNFVFMKTMNFQPPKLHASFFFNFVSLGSSKRKIKMCFTLKK